MKKWLLLILFGGWAGLLGFGYLLVSAAQASDLDQQTEALARVHQLLAYEKIDAAAKQLDQFFVRFPNEALKTEDETTMFYHLETDIRHAFLFQAESSEALEQKLYRLDLFVDALQDEGGQLWKEQVQRMETKLEAWAHQEKAWTKEEWEALHKVYHLVYPCLYISAPADLLKRMQAQVEHLHFSVQNQAADGDSQQVIKAFHADLFDLLGEKWADMPDLSFYLIFFFTGGMILSTLSYVAVRKYIGQRKGEKHAIRSKD